MRIINRTKNLWRVPQDFMKVINLTKSSWNSIWRSHHDHQPSQEFMKGYLTRFIKIMSCTKSLEKSISNDSRGSSIARRILKGFVTIISRTESLWQKTYRGSSGLPTLFLQVSQTIWKTFQFINNFKRVSEVVSRNFYFINLTMYTRRLSKSSYKSYNRWTANRA
jgi:hypothetical protein